MKKVLLLVALLFLASFAYAEPQGVQKVLIMPLQDGVSFNTITFADYSATGWVTAPSVAMKGRKQFLIINNDSTNDCYLTGVSGSTTYGTLKSGGKVASFKASSDLNIFVSANTAMSVEIWEIR